MSEATEASGKKTEVEVVKMEDGREVGFAGKRKVLKDILIDNSKIVVDGSTTTLEAGAVQLRMDFRNGATRLFPIHVGLMAQFAGHGAAQKYGDELAAPASKPLSEDDMVLAVEALHEQLFDRATWREVSEGGGFAGASVVVKAIAEASGKSIPEVKEFLQKKLDTAKEKGEKLSRNDLYQSFRNPNSKVGQIIKRMEEERLSKTAKVDADEVLAELG